MYIDSEPMLTVLEGGEIIPADALGGDIQVYDDSVLAQLSSSGFLPRLQLLISNSEKVKRGEFPMNHYALIVGQQYIDLGTQVDVIPIAWRPKAMEMGAESVTNFYMHDKVMSPEFKDVMARSEVKDSGCMFGQEVLLWIPAAPDAGKIATLFFGSKSARREFTESKLDKKMRQSVTLRSHYIETKKFAWQAMQVVTCSTPVDPPTGEWIAKLREELDKFNNPPKQDIEKAETASNPSGRER